MTNDAQKIEEAAEAFLYSAGPVGFKAGVAWRDQNPREVSVTVALSNLKEACELLDIYMDEGSNIPVAIRHHVIEKLDRAIKYIEDELQNVEDDKEAK